MAELAYSRVDCPFLSCENPDDCAPAQACRFAARMTVREALAHLLELINNGVVASPDEHADSSVDDVLVFRATTNRLKAALGEPYEPNVLSESIELRHQLGRAREAMKIHAEARQDAERRVAELEEQLDDTRSELDT